MNISIDRSISYLKYANFIVILGSSITWTGLSYDLVIQFQEPRLMAFMQVLAVLSSFIGPFVALWLLTYKQMRSIIVVSELFASVCCVLIYLVLIYQKGGELNTLVWIGLAIFSILLSGAISSLFIEPLYASLIEKQNATNNAVRSGFAVFSCLCILSKLFGMSLGPILFSSFGSNSLLINSISFLITAFLLRAAMMGLPLDNKLNIIRPEQVTLFRKSAWVEIVKLPLIETSIANSLIFIVVLTFSTRILILEATPSQVSLFWFGATGCAFVSHFVLSKSSNFISVLFDLERRFGFLQILPIGIGLFTDNINAVLVAQWIFSFFNPLATNQSRTDFYYAFGRDSDKALDAYAMRNILTNCIIMVFSLIVFSMDFELHIFFIYLSLMALILIRWLIALYIKVRDRQRHIAI